MSTSKDNGSARRTRLAYPDSRLTPAQSRWRRVCDAGARIERDLRNFTRVIESEAVA
jgi:hypothetical protein